MITSGIQILNTITFQHTPSDNGFAFLEQVKKILQPTDMSLKVTLPD